MAIGEGYETVLGTVVVAALAIGAAVGAHAFVGDTAVDTGATPGVTTSIAMSDDFCTLMGEMVAYMGASEDAYVTATLTVLGSVDEATEVDAMHAWGEIALEYWNGFREYERHAAEVVTDPTIARAFDSSLAGIEIEGVRPAQVAIDALQPDGFLERLDGDDISASDQVIVLEARSANEAISAYVLSECDVELGGGSSPGSAESSAKTDAITLGQEISVAFVDWNEGDPLPQVSVADGMFGVTVTSVSDGGTSTGTTSFSAASSDPAIIEQVITSPMDWCVSVADNAATPPTTFRYSATGGVEEGTCAALAADA